MKSDDSFKLRWYQSPWGDSTEFAMIAQKNGKRYVAKPVNLEFVPIEEGQMIEPTFRVNGEASREFLQGIANSIADEGIKSTQDAKLEGKLLATERHLKDLQKLLFKK